jgi:hypothetical protein
MCISIYVSSLLLFLDEYLIIFALKFCNMTMKACLKIRVVPTGDVRFKCCLNKSTSEHWTPLIFETLIYQIQFSDLKARVDRTSRLRIGRCRYCCACLICRVVFTFVVPKRLRKHVLISMDHHGSSTDRLNIDPTTHVFELGTSNPTKIWIYQYIMSVLRNMIQCPHAGEVP